jgi:hypothetical protein
MPVLAVNYGPLGGQFTNPATQTSLTLLTPAGVTPGCTLVASFWTRNGGDPVTPPPGWTVRTEVNMSVSRWWTGERKAVAGEPAAHIWTWATPALVTIGAIAAYRFVAAAPPLVTGGSNTTRNGAWPAVTLDDNNDLFYFAAFVEQNPKTDAPAWTFPDGALQRFLGFIDGSGIFATFRWWFVIADRVPGAGSYAQTWDFTPNAGANRGSHAGVQSGPDGALLGSKMRRLRH